MASAVVRFVDAASSGGDGTTNATSGATAAYASLSAALAAEFAIRGDLVSADVQLSIVCGGTTADIVRVNQANLWTTDATRYLLLVAGSGAAAGTSWSTSKYRYSVSEPGAAAMVLNGISHLRFRGLQMENRSNSTGVGGITASTLAPADVRFEELFVRVSGTPTSASAGVTLSTGGGSHRIANCILQNWTGSAGVGVRVSSNTPAALHQIYACTFVDCFNAITCTNSDGTTTVKDCLFSDSVDEDIAATGANVDAVDFCATTAATFGTSIVAGTGNDFGQTFTFAGAFDFALSASDTGAKGLGTNLTADADFPVSTDITGAVRGSTWDIGAHQVTSASQTPSTANSTCAASPASVIPDVATTITVTVKDASNVVISGASVALVTDGSGAFGSASGNTNGSGVYATTYTPSAVGDGSHLITATCTANAVPIEETATVTVTVSGGTVGAGYWRRRR